MSETSLCCYILLNFYILQKPSRAAEGYPENANVLFKTTLISDFIMGTNYLSILKESNQLVFDRASEVFSRHPLTTEEIRESCKDLKVLGPRELKQLVKWREKLRLFMDQVESEEDEEMVKRVGGEDNDDDNDVQLRGIDEKIKALASSEAAEVKR